MQLRPLDPLAKASLYQRVLKNPAKSFNLSEAQFESVGNSRPQLIAREDNTVVVGYLHRDQLQIHYGFPSREFFQDHFQQFFDHVIKGAIKEEAPRGILLSFRDRSNRAAAEPVFWALALDQGAEWVEMNLTPVPEMDPPSDQLEGGFSIREATDADRDAIADIEAEVSGKPRLSESGITSIFEHAAWLRVITDASGVAVGYLDLNTASGGWGVIDQLAVRSDLRNSLFGPLLGWSIAFLRNNGCRRVRQVGYIGDTVTLGALRARGFTPGEAGVDYTRVVDPAEVAAQWQERKAHSSIIKMGDWR